MGGVDLLRSLNMVGVAQLVRVSDCGSEGRRFESGLPPQKIKQPIGLLNFLSNPKDWYVIGAPKRCMELPLGAYGITRQRVFPCTFGLITCTASP